MQINFAQFVVSNTQVSLCPKPDRPEFAFIGRSNVGKSSLINMLTNRPGLAKTSQTPGKTQLINHFDINGKWYLVDLPGYGFAKVPLAIVKKWETFIREYIITRENLYCLFVLLDARHKPQKIDLEFMGWLGENQVPFAMVFTKSDKLGPVRLASNVEAYKQVMLESWEELPPVFVSSAESKLGRDSILDFIERTLGS